MSGHFKATFLGLISRSLALFLGVFIMVFAFGQEVLPASQISRGEFDQRVIEHLRLHVPKEFREAWLNAEKSSWEPWLNKQNGFIRRQLFWDQEREEATLLITWASKKDWKAIPQSELEVMQNLFEQFAREGTGQKIGNPFPLQFEGELLPQ